MRQAREAVWLATVFGLALLALVTLARCGDNERFVERVCLDMSGAVIDCPAKEAK